MTDKQKTNLKMYIYANLEDGKDVYERYNTQLKLDGIHKQIREVFKQLLQKKVSFKYDNVLVNGDYVLSYYYTSISNKVDVVHQDDFISIDLDDFLNYGEELLDFLTKKEHYYKVGMYLSEPLVEVSKLKKENK